MSRLGAMVGIDETQAIAVSELQLRRLPREQRARVRVQVEELEKQLSDHEDD